MTLVEQKMKNIALLGDINHLRRLFSGGEVDQGGNFLDVAFREFPLDGERVATEQALQDSVKRYGDSVVAAHQRGRGRMPCC